MTILSRWLPFLKRFTGFNVAQCDGLSETLAPEPVALPGREIVPVAEAVIAASGVAFRVGGSQAFYAPGIDVVQVPPQPAFFDQINHYRTALHELCHAMGHPSRLDRKLLNAFGGKDYAREELVAEMGSAFLCASLGIVTTVRHADYLASWLEVLREDNRAIFRAASAASKAADWLLGRHRAASIPSDPVIPDAPSFRVPEGARGTRGRVSPVSCASLATMRIDETGAHQGAHLMELQFIPLDRLSISRTNMRYARKALDVTDLLSSVRRRGVLQPVIVRPTGSKDVSGGSAATYEIVAGARRFTAARIVADERAGPVDGGSDAEPLPCAILSLGADADAVEASLIDNVARRDADEVTQWATFTRLVKEGRSVNDIGANFDIPEAMVRRVLALGNSLPRIRGMYGRNEIYGVTVRHLTLASKRQQQDWLALADDPDQRAPTGHGLEAWLFGGQSIPVGFALFDVEARGLATVADLFGEDRYVTDATAFWTAQDAAIATRREAYLADGWAGVTVIPPTEHFQSWEYEKKGGRVYIDVRHSGEVIVHEGYVGRRDAECAARTRTSADAKPVRREIISACQT